MSSIRIAFLSSLLLAVTAPARAEQYWVAWEGNDYPENEGWERIVDGPGPATRSINDGVMTLDGRWDRQVDDYYRMDRTLDPNMGESFVLQWRVRVVEVIGNPLGLYDPGVGVFSDSGNELTFVLGVDFIRSYHEEGTTVPIEPGVFHTFDVLSPDMRTYELRIDGAIAYHGVFWDQFRQSGIDWGDYTRGSASLTEWDYFRFGVVPEPSCNRLVACLLCLSPIMRRRSRRL